ncbi:MAG: hypothetical protein AAB799_01330 [Patescibacteria group bacterium]
MSTSRLPVTERVLRVEPPVMVNVSDSSFWGLNVVEPIPLVLVEGNWIAVGVILWNEEKES